MVQGGGGGTGSCKVCMPCGSGLSSSDAVEGSVNGCGKTLARCSLPPEVKRPVVARCGVVNGPRPPEVPELLATGMRGATYVC